MPRPPLPSNIVCYHCRSIETSKAGFDKGKQRFYCRACRRWFRENPILPKGGKRNRGGQPKSSPSKGHLILSLQAIAQRLGRTPTTNEITEQSKAGGSFPLNNYYDAFGSFLEALKKANLKSNYRQEFDKGKLLSELGELRAKLKRPLLGKDVLTARKKGKVSSIYHFQRAFGSVPKAIEAAGAGQKNYNRQEMIEILRSLDAKLDRPVLAFDIDALYDQGESPHHRRFEREFGGMAKARRAAGIHNFYKKDSELSRRWQKYTPEKLIDQLRALGERLGRKPSDRDINQASKEKLCASAVTFSRMFGNLPEAYRKAGFEKIKPRSYTDREILDALKKLAREKGKMLTYHELVAGSKAGKCPSPGTIVSRIGKLTDLKSKYNFG